MDALVSAALHEIAVEASQGCPLPKLWAGLQLPAAALEINLDARVKQMLWKQVLDVPRVTIVTPEAKTLEAYHPSIQSVQEAEKLGVHVVAPEGLRESCLGLYDGKLCDAAISKDQRELLERLAKARSQGVTQSQLGKEFKTGGNKMFYVVKSLESRGLVVRHATIVRTHQPASKGPTSKFVPIVATNLVHLSRYEKEQSLGSHARYEIPSSSKSNHTHSSSPTSTSGDPGAAGEEGPTEEVLINDDYPAMQRICEKLEAADDKVMVVSDLKLDLNYRFAQGHRSWRRLAKRLQDAGMVEIFNAQIAGAKIAPCIRLLKSFNTKAFNAGNDDTEGEAQLRGVKRGQVTEQVVESALDRQIYDLIDSAGPAGLYMMDIWKQLGLNNKRNYFRVTNMLSKGCIVSEAEQHKKSMLYRLRTAPNATLAANLAANRTAAVAPENADLEPQYVVPLAQFAPLSTAKIRRTRKAPEKEKGQEKEKDKQKQKEKDKEKERAGAKDKGKVKEQEKYSAEDTTLSASNLPKDPEESNTCRALALVDLSIVKVDEDEPLVTTSGQMYPLPLQTTTAIQRELRIMQRLHEEKFIPRVELHRWIEESEKDRKDTMMDRKTLTRLLQKLQREGRVKCIVLSMPGLTNCGRSRQSEVVLLPEVQVGPELLAKVHDRIRQFDMMNRGYGSSKLKADASTVPILMTVKQIHKGKKRIFESAAEAEAEKARTLSENGFVPAKMVRVRMLHTFLWSYANGISEYADEELVMKPPDDSSCRVFSLALAVKAMPVDLFLQVVGSTKSTEELEPYINKELRLCDLSEEISSSLMVSHANSRLSWLIDILRRLKLIRLVMGTGSLPKTSFNRGSTYSLEASLIYAMETQPFIEEPAPQPLSSLSLDAFDLTPRARHEFTMTSSESLEAYWQTLEYCFSGALPTVARKAFPGNSVPELFGLRSWTSLRVMTSEQRKGLMKRVEEGGEERRLSHAECLLLARELNLSPEQVLRVSYEKNRRLRLVQLRNEKLDNEVSRGHRIKPNIHAGANKRVVTDADLMEAAHVRAFKRQRQLEQAEAAPPPSEPTGLADIILKEGETTEPHEEEVEEDEEEDKATEENPLNISKTISKLKQTRSKRFPWSEALDKVLVRCYTRQRAILGARNHRVEWAHIPNLPAPPAACRRRTALMKSDPAIRKALNNLSSVLCARYVKRPDDAPAVSTVWRKNAETDVTEEVSQPSPRKDTQQPEDELPWDSFEYPAVAAAFEEVMQLRNIAKQISSKRTTVVSVPKLPKTRERPRKLRVVVPKVIPKPKDPAPTKEPVVEQKGDPGRARAPRIRKRKKSEKPVTLGEPISEEVVRRSLGIANAVELVKFVLLNAASAEVPSDVVDALRRCEEAHVFAAFNFLRYQDYVIHGSSGQPYVLSQKFFYNASASRFPMATALEALYTTQWLAEHDSEVDEDWVPLPSENLCGQLIQLLGIVSKGEFNIAPFLPTEGVGESEDNKNVVHGTKRKTEGGQEIQFMKPKIQRSDSSSFGFRRERGFPGVQVCIHRATKAVGELVDAAVLESQENAEDMDLDWEQARNTEAALVDVASEAMEVDVVLPSAAGDVSEAREADVACSSAADVSEVTTAREVDVAVYSATESTDAMKVDVAVPSATGYSSESVDPTNVEITEVDVAMTSAPEVDVVASSAAVQVPEPTKETAEFDSVARNVSESAEAGEGNLALIGVASNSKLVDCIDHFCSTSEDTSDADEAKLDSEVLEATAHAIEAAGKDGLSIRQVLERTGHRMTDEVVWKCISALETFDVVKQVNAYDHVRVISAAHSAPFFIHVKAKNGLRGGTNADPSDRGHGESSGLSTMATLRSIATGSRSWTRNNVPSDTSSLPPPEQDEISHTVPMLPWLTGDGGVNMSLLKALTRRVLGVVMQNPGILEEHLVNQLHVLNPQTARQFLRLLESDGHVKVRKVLQATPPGPPGLLRHLIKVKSPSAKPLFGSHYYANCTSGVML